MYENGNQEPHVSRCDDDVVLSVVSHYNACPKGGTEKGSLLVVLGSHMESWSRGKYKAQKFSSHHDYSDGEICIQLDLILQL
ncbi:hypothetical protein KP509_10G026500 [Ceratopteris richardii]|nr:hypothetical protein KP509_10G026500 [Ceratopteris richardii]